MWPASTVLTTLRSQFLKGLCRTLLLSLRQPVLAPLFPDLLKSIFSALVGRRRASLLIDLLAPAARVDHPCEGTVRQSVLGESLVRPLPHNDAEEAVESTLNRSPAHNGQSCADHDLGLRALSYGVRATRRTQRRPRWYPPLSPANVLQGFTHRIGSERGQSDVRDRNDIFSALLQSHRSCGDFYFESPIAGPNLESLASFDVECLAKRFWDDDSPGRVNGSFHGKNNGITMV
jgi:hypothetical protein